MQERFTLFVDESGQAGIAKVRSGKSSGASPYMTLGAALISNRSRKATEDALARIASDFDKKELHCSRLKHYQLLHYARMIGQRKMRLFGVISHKATLGRYKAAIAEDSSRYYNKCAQYLLERVGWFMEARSIPAENLDIVFEKTNNDYGAMRNLLRSCQSTPKHAATKRLQRIDVDRIDVRKKEEEPILQLADLVAHALYKCVDKTDSNFGIPEPRYLRELGPHFFGNPNTNLVLGAGLYGVHELDDLDLDEDVREVLEQLEAHPLSAA